MYIALFSLSLFCFIFSLLKAIPQTENKNLKLPYKAIYCFLIIAGIALFAAWLPDIIQSLINKGPLELIENYTTEPTYVFDMGIIAPLCIMAAFFLRKKKNIAYPVLVTLLMLCSVVGIMVCIQTFFQMSSGVELPLPTLATKVILFIVLAIISIVLLIIILTRLTKNKEKDISDTAGIKN